MITLAQICAEYKIGARTFNAVVGLLKAKPKPKHGRVFYELDPRDDFILRCSRNHISSFRGEGRSNIHIIPFHRFLCLKFLTTPRDEALGEIHLRNLASARFGPGYYKKLENLFVSRIPKELRALVRKKGAPNKKQLGAYEMLLNVLGVVAPYNFPQWMDNFFSFLGDPRQKNIVETVITTRGDRSDHQRALEELSGQQWKNVALDLYQSVFYDVSELSERDWAYYLSIILPTERRSKGKARGMSTDELRIQEGSNPHFQETLQLVAVNLEKRLRGTLRMKGEAFEQLHRLIGSYTKVGVMTGGVERPNVGGTFFQNISIVPSQSTFKTISAEIQGQIADGKS